jgi:hypothetical protein
MPASGCRRYLGVQEMEEAQMRGMAVFDGDAFREIEGIV